MKSSIYIYVKSFILCFSLFALLLGVSSCSFAPGANDGNSNYTPPENGDDEKEKEENKKLIPQIVINEAPAEDTASRIYTKLFYKIEEAVRVVDDSAAKTESEIVVGKSNRQITKDAYSALAKLNKEEKEVGYLIYFDGQSYALAYETDKYEINAAAQLCVDYFIENTIPDYGNENLKEGVIYSGKLDPLEYQRMLDQKSRDLQWAYLEAAAGKEVVEAAKEYYARYEVNFVEWCANLYDPETGGFYYSNAARDNLGYLPDIESSFQMLSMLESSGMIDHLGGSIYNLPKDFLTKMAIWIKGLQHPGGYFYHPQWGKEATDKKVTRRGRDLSYGCAVLTYAGLSPTYDTPAGTKGDYTLTDGTKVDANGDPIAAAVLTAKLSQSSAFAVSKVVATASNAEIPEHLISAESFREYLYGLDLKNNSYWVGNQLSNQVGEIKKRDQELDGALVEVLTEWLVEFQNPQNGMWEWRDEDDPSYSDYDGVNGILKLLTLFNNLGIEYPNPAPAAESIVKSIYTDDPVGSVCYCYNAWFALEDLFKNLNTHTKNPSETNKMIAEIRENLRKDAPALIRKSLEKVMVFVKDDGSSSFAPNESSGTSQGMWVTIPHTNEGDVNGSLINTFGVLNHMFKVLGWSRPSVYGKAEYYLFMDIINSKASVVKNEETLPVFDYENGKADFISLERCNSSGEKKIVTTETPDGNGKAFMFESKGDGHDLLYLNTQTGYLLPKSYVFESDLKLVTEQSGYFMRIFLDQAYSVGMIIEDGKIRFIDTSKTGAGRVEKELGFTANVNEWFKLRIEYYPGDSDTMLARIYLNGELVAESNNFYDPDGVGIPSESVKRARIEIFTANTATLYLDNTVVSISYKEK